MLVIINNLETEGSLKLFLAACKVWPPSSGNLPVNSCSLYSSRPQIIASGCCANIVINVAFR